MIKYILKRLFISIFVLLGVSIILYNDWLNAYDVTMNVGTSLTFSVKVGNTTLTDVAWSIPDGTTCCTVGSAPNVIKAVTSGNVYLSASYNGQTIKCYIRIN